MVLPKLAALDLARPLSTRTRRSGETPAVSRPLNMVAPAAPPAKRPIVPAGDRSLLEIRKLADCGQWEAAASACETLLVTTPMDAGAHFYRAMIHEQVGQAEECEKALRRAIYLDRKLVLPHYHLGLFLLRRDDSLGASRAFRNVVTLLKDSPDGDLVADGDKITAGQMREAVDMHLKLIGGAL